MIDRPLSDKTVNGMRVSGVQGRCLFVTSLIGYLLFGCGCGFFGTNDGVATEQAYSSLEEAKALYADGKFDDSRNAVQRALQLGGLQPDSYCDSLALLVQSEVKLGKIDEAKKALSMLQEGDADLKRLRDLQDMIEAREEELRGRAGERP